MNTIQSKAAIALTSPAVWTLVGLFVYNTLEANLALFPSAWSGVVNVVLVILTGYLHSSKVQTAAIIGRTH